METLRFNRRDDAPLEVVGEVAARESSERNFHSHSVAEFAFAPPGTRCSGCRWIEVHIYLVAEWISGYADHDRRGRYVVVTRGMTRVPGETEFRSVTATDSPYEVVELLTVRRHNGRDGGTTDAYIPASNARALARAAEEDAGLRDAYINRAVV